MTSYPLFQRCILFTLSTESILQAESILASYCSVPISVHFFQPVCIFFNKNNDDTARIILHSVIKNDDKTWKIGAISKIMKINAIFNKHIFFSSLFKNHHFYKDLVLWTMFSFSLFLSFFLLTLLDFARDNDILLYYRNLIWYTELCQYSTCIAIFAIRYNFIAIFISKMFPLYTVLSLFVKYSLEIFAGNTSLFFHFRALSFS